MLNDELFEVIVNFEESLKKKRLPDFNKNLHRAEQVLRILKSEFFDFDELESRRACKGRTRDLWEKFWEHPEVKRELDHYNLKTDAKREQMAGVFRLLRR
jgi:hypothetical protein